MKGCNHNWIFLGKKEDKEKTLEKSRKYFCTNCLAIVYYDNEFNSWKTTDDNDELYEERKNKKEDVENDNR